MSDEPEVLIWLEGTVGRITLNRPQALHALTTNMCWVMTEALLAWRDNPTIELVMIDHSGERGFCAGGDIRMLAESGAGDGILAREFFRTEYRLNSLMQVYPKPLVAFMDGITMGGGVGLSQPCRFRVATERTVFAMPETGIGLFPDVGGGWHLSRMRDNVGLWLALTGARIKAADCELCGIATVYVESTHLRQLKRAIVQMPHGLESILSIFRAEPGEGLLPAHGAKIADCFAHDGVEAIVTALKASPSDWAREQADIILSKSPISSEVAFRQLALGGQAKAFAQVMTMEYRLACRLVAGEDFLEGVRAIIIDRDGAPRWRPATLAEVTPASIDALFAPLSPADEWTPLEETS
jgi:enoyl-CoA hydratase